MDSNRLPLDFDLIDMKCWALNITSKEDVKKGGRDEKNHNYRVITFPTVKEKKYNAGLEFIIA